MWRILSPWWARIARIPEKSVSQSDRDTLKNLGDRLKMLVFGQDKAIEALTEAIKMARAGLGHEHKPVGSFLFAAYRGRENRGDGTAFESVGQLSCCALICPSIWNAIPSAV